MFPTELAGLDEDTRPISLEFANTVHWHASQHPEETLHTYADLVSWARRIGLTGDTQARRLKRQAQTQPESARRTLGRAVRLREAIYTIFTAIIDARPVPAEELDELNRNLKTIGETAMIRPSATGFIWAWETDRDDLGSFLGQIALSAASLLLSEKHRWVGQCADDRGCGWLFLDTSKNHSRRWCDMNDCGNRAKQKRLKERRNSRARALRPPASS
jgi:predicted RNA-binding Zn ribbon-like protein